MATALKHKQHSRRSYAKNRQVLGSVATSFSHKSSTNDMIKQSIKSWFETLKQMLVNKKGDR